MNTMLSYKCAVCKEIFETDNEDDVVSSVCESCQDYGVDYAEERGDGVTDYNCNCEDYPCCGHQQKA